MAPVKILAVCLGNICRSPAAEAALKESLSANGFNDAVVDSAGTGGWHVGEKPDGRIRAAGKRAGLLIDGAARKVDVADFDSFDYILAMDKSNYLNLAILSSKTNHYKKKKEEKVEGVGAKLFMFGEFAGPAFVGNENKHGNPPEVPDPYYGSDSDFDYVVKMVRDCSENFVCRLKNGTLPRKSSVCT
eukprot:ANDGO_08487.mRNA.1 Low molecular weight phosphotyrosine protein phosphatase